MGFWSSERLAAELPRLVTGYRWERITNGSYELRLAGEYYTTDRKQKETIAAGSQIRIDPGQFGRLLTEEEIEVPPGVLGLISIKYTYKKNGLINISGFHVDPGFSGRLEFAVYNAGPGPQLLTVGAPVFLIWFADLDQVTKDTYKGIRKNQTTISDQDVALLAAGEVVSPMAIKTALDSLQLEMKLMSELREEVAGLRGDVRVIQIIGSVAVTAALTVGACVARELRPQPTVTGTTPVQTTAPATAAEPSMRPDEPSSMPLSTTPSGPPGGAGKFAPLSEPISTPSPKPALSPTDGSGKATPRVAASPRNRS